MSTVAKLELLVRYFFGLPEAQILNCGIKKSAISNDLTSTEFMVPQSL
jgi:hypothetical protein